jgi:hypothetical protein
MGRRKLFAHSLTANLIEAEMANFVKSPPRRSILLSTGFYDLNDIDAAALELQLMISNIEGSWRRGRRKFHTHSLKVDLIGGGDGKLISIHL